MTVQVNYPGVYIDEVTSAGAISGVGTSTAAFLGPSASGPLNEPVKITSWEKFKKVFGQEPLSGFYLWYAVRGFFQNGGTVCYVTRVSNGKFDRKTLMDRNSPGSPKETVLVLARTPGDNSANPIQLIVADSNAVNTELFRPSVKVKSASASVIEVDNSSSTSNDAAELAAKFRKGDSIYISEGTNNDTAKVDKVEGVNIRLSVPISLVTALTHTYSNNATVRLANLTSQDDTIRVVDGKKLCAGSVLRIGSGTPQIIGVVKSVQVERISASLTTYRVVLKAPLDQTVVLTSSVTVKSQEFSLKVSQGTTYSHIYNELSMDPGHPNYFATVIYNDPSGIVLAYPFEPPSNTAVPNNRPQNSSTSSPFERLQGGSAEDNSTLTSGDYNEALARLEAIDDINMIAIPDRTDQDVQSAIKDQCERLKDRIAILDSRPGAELSGAGSVVEQWGDINSIKGYSALYYPWLYVSPAEGTGRVLVPPSGHIAGVYARTDATRGVHKAPAGTEANVRGSLGIDIPISDTDQGQLNTQGINIIRVFQGSGQPVVWGARTTAPAGSDWQYISTRRLFLFIEESIQESIRWAVFEPNNLALWQKLKRVIRAFLRQQWRDGALFGETEDKAFYVRIDEDINPESERQLGRLYIEIGIKPAFPAEFIVVRIGIWQGGSQILEA